MLNVRRFEALCQAIIDAGLNRIDYTVQAMTSADDLKFLRASSKNIKRENGRKAGNATLKAIEYLHENRMYVVGGLIVGNPDDTREAIMANLEFAQKYIDWPYIQHPTPYPRTPMTKDFRDRGLITTESFEEYDGTTAVVRSEQLASEEIEFMRWRADRWMKLRHIPAALFHDPMFVLRNGRRMFAHTFRGSTIKSLLGFEDERKAFERYRAIRRAEREYV